MQANLKYINRDAVAALLGIADDAPQTSNKVLVIDLRRHDERTFYGTIPGASLVPAQG